MLRTIVATSSILFSIFAATVCAQARELASKTTNSIIREHMEVIGSGKVHVGTADKYEGKEIKLSRDDPAAKVQHYMIPSSRAGILNGNTVVLNKSTQKPMAQ